MDKKENWIAMGYLKGAFGIKGWVKVQPSTEYVDSLLAYDTWRLSSKDGQIFDAQLAQSSVSNNELHVRFSHIHDRDQAALLRGCTIYIPREAFAQTDDNEFYWADLMGMSVQNRDNMTLGKVSKLLETGAHDVMVVRGEYGEKLIPFVSQFIDDVDQDKRIINVDWGLDY